MRIETKVGNCPVVIQFYNRRQAIACRLEIKGRTTPERVEQYLGISLCLPTDKFNFALGCKYALHDLLLSHFRTADNRTWRAALWTAFFSAIEICSDSAKSIDSKMSYRRIHNYQAATRSRLELCIRPGTDKFSSVEEFGSAMS